LAIVDLTIYGAGVFGLSVAFACARRGAKVRVIDPGGVARGASGGIVGALAPHVPENWNPKKAFQFESLLMAEAFWKDVADMGGRDPGYVRSGRVQPLVDEHQVALAEQRAASAKTLWGEAATWAVVTRDALGERLIPHSSTGRYIHDTLSAYLHPRRGTQALAAAVEALGGEVVRDGDAEGQVVWATGVHGLKELSDQFARPIGNGVKGQAALFDYDARERPQLFAENLHFIPHGDGTLAVGSTSERNYDHSQTTDIQLDALIEKARGILPELKEAPVIERWAGVRPRAKSRAPMLGPWPDRPGHFIANGGFKIGFGMAPKVGEVMADLILEGHDKVPDGFRVTDNL